MALSKDSIRYAEWVEEKRQMMKKRWEDPEFREKTLKRLHEIRRCKRGTKWQREVKKRKELRIKEALEKAIKNEKKIKNCLRCGKEMKPRLISKYPIKYIYFFKCKCYPKGYYTD